MRLPFPYHSLAPTVGDWRSLPAPERVEPFAFLKDASLPLVLTPVEPCSFGLACLQSAWGPSGPRN